ncbi:MAG: peptide-methionine (S)-S-oxide reductase [Spirochaetaceae bacterium]|nr:MAG: peptide-methionine (S)-S-oxide reductase [Spirochaetaceae bacterium]
MSDTRQTATLGNGCFWCTEAVYQRLPGVISVQPGYAGGRATNPTYEQVCGGATGHAEVVQLVFDSAVVSYAALLERFFASHDPTTLNRQGADVGTQYRSVIFYHDESQRRVAAQVLAATAGQFVDPIVTEIVPYDTFYPAEQYHHDYFNRNPQAGYCAVVIRPKLVKLGLKP